MVCLKDQISVIKSSSVRYISHSALFSKHKRQSLFFQESILLIMGSQYVNDDDVQNKNKKIPNSIQCHQGVYKSRFEFCDELRIEFSDADIFNWQQMQTKDRYVPANSPLGSFAKFEVNSKGFNIKPSNIVELIINSVYYHGTDNKYKKIYHCQGFSREAKATMRLIVGFCLYGAIDDNHWRAVFNHCNPYDLKLKSKFRSALNCILRDPMNSDTFFTKIKNSFKEKTKNLMEKKLMISQLNEFDIKIEHYNYLYFISIYLKI